MYGFLIEIVTRPVQILCYFAIKSESESTELTFIKSSNIGRVLYQPGKRLFSGYNIKVSNAQS